MAYMQPRLARGLLDVATSVVSYLALSLLIYATLGVSLALMLALAVPAAGFLVRTFVVFTTARTGRCCRPGAPTRISAGFSGCFGRGPA